MIDFVFFGEFLNYWINKFIFNIGLFIMLYY